uniref:EGF-like domain-containing protein n=1 Tax=Strongyloides papillosus TaxID=174720 RepID=A0A0N5C4H1_STREA
MQEITDEMMENRKKHYKAENYQLEYSRGLSQPIYFSKILKGQKIDKYTKSYCHDNIERSVNVYKLSLTDDFLKSEKYNDKLVLSINEVVRKVKIELYISRPYANLIGDSFEVLTKHLFCNLRYCEIGFFHSCDRNSQNSGIFGALLTVFRSEMFGYYYIGFTSSNEYRNLILKLIPKNNDNKHVFNVVFCPGENWVHKRSEVDYFLDDSNLVGAILMDNSTRRLFLKLAYCHNNNNKIFIKCGRLDQKYMSSIDVGYECNDYNKEEANRIHNKDEKKTDMLVISNDILMCNGHNIFKSSSIIISVLPPENNFNKAGIFKVSKVNQTTNLYPEQELQLIDVNDIIKTHSGATEYLGYVVNYEPKCRVPYLNVKLYLKISDTIQKFENKANDNFGKIDTYVVDRKGINSVPVGCHVVFDEKKHPAFNHFYENCCQPSLLMFNGKTKKFIEITDIQSFQPNNMYKCALKVKNANSKSGQQKYIHETDFTINLIDPSLNKT